MVAARRLWVRLKVPSKYLTTLPKFATFVSKTQLRKLAQAERRAASGSSSTTNSQKSSPAPPETNSNNAGSANNNNNNNNGGIGGVGGGGVGTASGGASNISQYKINAGLKESSTSGLTMNSINSALYTLDKSGKPCKRWVKKTKSFKTFTGFKMKYTVYEPKPAPPTQVGEEKSTKVDARVVKAEQNEDVATVTS
ncbi:hypothetical protein KGF56_004849 [Candida oxycetoniae]|uniref:Uncharacterized protein n=1 Tax=Candida oxycetoniae TaxID=497107 RepID=A0AAI9STN7_9ASCO|nr:uncharacterized protein KGF56_004849 [Candida oxycetoniae]KAI3402441.2 hypothetical protein KGF56_004849 [Candida oxycetoniae]